MEFFRGDERKAFSKVETHLVPEHALGACASAVVFFDPFAQDAFEEIVILVHGTSVASASFG
jgi:hypothetical protein